MPRTARQKSALGYYHVMLRGNGRMLLFESDADRERFLALLTRMTETWPIAVIAWCLMSNHVHLILSDDAGNLSEAMHSLATGYATGFNGRTGHVGSVFDGRFKSVPIESERQLLAAVRYVHDNPVRAGVGSREDYPWSSYREYVDGPHLASVGVVLGIVGGAPGFLALSESAVPSGYYFRSGARIPEEDALEVARSVAAPAEVGEIRQMGPAARDECLRRLRRAGLSIKQIERLTGIGRYSIDRALLAGAKAPNRPVPNEQLV